jgi:hypothetical protein
MTERMPCPKCSGKNTSFTNSGDNPWNPYPSGVEYSCMLCGFRLYGQKAIDKVEEWRAGAKMREELLAKMRAEEARRSAELRSRLTEKSLLEGIREIRAQETIRAEAPVKTLKENTPPKENISQEQDKLEKARQRKREREQLRRQKIKEAKNPSGISSPSKPRIQAPVLIQEEDPSKCAWFGCGNPKGLTSKYCSKTCSNKFAHAREIERKRLRKEESLKQSSP